MSNSGELRRASSSRSSPWVLYRKLGREQQPKVVTDLGWEARASTNAAVDALENWFGSPLLNHRPLCYAVATAHDKENNPARDAVLQVLSGMRGIDQHVTTDNPAGIPADWRSLTILVPVVITMAPLLAVSLGPNDAEPQLGQTTRELVVGRFMPDSDQESPVWVVHADGLDDFVRDYARTIENLGYR